MDGTNKTTDVQVSVYTEWVYTMNGWQIGNIADKTLSMSRSDM